MNKIKKTNKKKIKKIYKIFIILSFVIANIFILSACGNNSQDNNLNGSDYNADRTSSIQNNTNTNQENKNNIETPPISENTEEQKTTESTISEFSTNILTKSQNRANNIKITCDKINGMEVKPGETFSFCARTGVSKESEGYKKADVIVGKSIIKALGGGNCQVSTTLYNAVLQSQDLEVIERHPHGKKVNYVPEGKDAAISHGSKDFKFKNNSDKTLKIYASSDGKNVSIKLVLIQ